MTFSKEIKEAILVIIVLPIIAFVSFILAYKVGEKI